MGYSMYMEYGFFKSCWNNIRLLNNNNNNNNNNLGKTDAFMARIKRHGVVPCVWCAAAVCV